MWNGSRRRGALLVMAWLLAVAVSPATAQTDQPPADGRRRINEVDDDGYWGTLWPHTRKKTEFAVGIGGGATMRVGPRWDYRVDFRWYNPKAEWPESWRLYNGLSLRFADRR